MSLLDPKTHDRTIVYTGSGDDTTSKGDELDELLEKIQLLTGSRFYDYETKETARRLLKQYGVQERIDELNSLPNSSIEATYHGSTGVILVKNVIKRITELTALKDKETE